MIRIENRSFKFNKDSNTIFEGILSLPDIKGCERDLLNVPILSTLQAITESFTTVRNLVQNKQFCSSINKMTVVSIAVITHVTQRMKEGMSGNRLILDRLHHHSKKVSQAQSSA